MLQGHAHVKGKSEKERRPKTKGGHIKKRQKKRLAGGGPQGGVQGTAREGKEIHHLK